MTRALIHQLGWTPIRGTKWLEVDSVELDGAGILGDRAWSPIDMSNCCLKAAKHPELMLLDPTVVELPTPGDETTRAHYWDREFPASVHGGAAAAALAEAVGKPTLLAHTNTRPGFIWGAPLSVICLSDVEQLPKPLTRYRANVIIDDLAEPLHLGPGTQLRLGAAVICITNPIDRCTVIEHNPTTGLRDERILRQLGPRLELGWGATVVTPGKVGARDPITLER